MIKHKYENEYKRDSTDYILLSLMGVFYIILLINYKNTIDNSIIMINNNGYINININSRFITYSLYISCIIFIVQCYRKLKYLFGILFISKFIYQAYNMWLIYEYINIIHNMSGYSYKTLHDDIYNSNNIIYITEVIISIVLFI